jgi:3-deoxy-7-phosphoheptulonate synthase
MPNRRPTSNLNVESLRPLLPPALLVEEIPASERGEAVVTAGRREVVEILEGRDDRLLVVVGPCSIHDPAAALDYGRRLLSLREELAGELCLIMRIYFEKPRTTVGWKGLINDPDLSGSFRINDGLRSARGLLRDLVELGLPCGTEFLDPISPQFTSDLIAWGAIGARTTESQVHRELASGLSMPVGFKNGTGGDIQVAVDAILAARHSHRFLGVTEQGLAAIVATRGNPCGHIILRGGSTGSNFDAASLEAAATSLERAGLPPAIMVDCSHGNSGKEFRRQPAVARELLDASGEGSRPIFGIMLESFIEEGRQEPASGELRYGQSITDACLGWDASAQLLRELADRVSRRRADKA